MATKQFSLKRDGNVKLSNNFNLKEFQCNDCSDTVIISYDLVRVLQTLRDYFKKPVTITSGYRTYAYNKSIGGAPASKHVTGKAVDIKVKDIHPFVVAAKAREILGVNGGVEVGVYGGKKGYVHIDVRSGQWNAYKLSQKDGYTSYAVLTPTLTSGNSRIERFVMNTLSELGFKKSTKYDTAIVKEFQKKHNLKADGIFGKNSWNKLIELLR